MQYFKINRGTITLNNSEILKEGMVVTDSVFDGYENKEEIIKSISNYSFLDKHPAFERNLEFL